MVSSYLFLPPYQNRSQLIPKCSRIMRGYFSRYKAKACGASQLIVTNKMFSTGTKPVMIPVLLPRNSKSTFTELVPRYFQFLDRLRLECRLLIVQSLAEKSAFVWVSRDTSFLLRKDSTKRL
jgi:hypothetical protein